MNKKKEIMELKAEVKKLTDEVIELKHNTTFYREKWVGEYDCIFKHIPVKDVVNLILKDLCLKLSVSPEEIELKTTYE